METQACCSTVCKVAEQRMQRESYEHAGIDAYFRHVPRAGNPYARSRDPFASASDVERLGTLAQHWWRGWDRAAAGLADRVRW